MTPFLWFTNNAKQNADTLAFYSELLGWTPRMSPSGVRVISAADGPYAGTAGEGAAWVPFARVHDVDAALDRAIELGAEIVVPKAIGHRMHFCVVRDPGGGTVALWQAAEY